MRTRPPRFTAYGLLSALTIATLLGRACAQTLAVGDPAPALQVDKWQFGGPLDLAADRGRRLQVIEFWAPNCPQAVFRLPRLNELQAGYGKEKITVISIAEASPEAVKECLAEQKLDVHFAMACDDYERNALSYMAAVGAEEVPYTFVIDRQGLVAWHGYPANGVGNVLQAMLKGEYTVETGREILKLEAMMGGALMAEQWTTVLTLLDRLIELNPNPFQYHMLKFEVLSAGKQDVEAAKACAPALLAGLTHYLDLDDFARHLMSGELGEEYYDLAVTFCRAAYEACEGTQKDIAHSYARAKFLNGDIDGAIELEKRALELAGGDDVFFRMTLEKYRKAARKD